MRIGIIGSGKIGASAARRFVAAGHEVALANSRGPETLVELADEVGPQAQPATIEEAARFGDVVLVAIPFGRHTDLPADALAGKIVIDANNYYASRDGHIAELDDGSTTSSELLAAHLPGARVVKAFNTIYWETLRDGARAESGDEPTVVVLAGDDAEAKATVSRLVEDIGFAPLDHGNLAEGGRRQQPGTAVYTTRALTLREAQEALA